MIQLRKSDVIWGMAVDCKGSCGQMERMETIDKTLKIKTVMGGTHLDASIHFFIVDF